MITSLGALNPHLVMSRVLWFDCPLHPRDRSMKCRGEVGVRLTPGTDGVMHFTDGWSWTGDWTTWRVTIRPSIKLDLLCGAHFTVTDGEITPG